MKDFDKINTWQYDDVDIRYNHAKGRVDMSMCRDNRLDWESVSDLSYLQNMYYNKTYMFSPKTRERLLELLSKDEYLYLGYLAGIVTKSGTVDVDELATQGFCGETTKNNLRATLGKIGVIKKSHRVKVKKGKFKWIFLMNPFISAGKTVNIKDQLLDSFKSTEWYEEHRIGDPKPKLKNKLTR